jgi:fructosamine-3-kinase
MMTHTLPSQDRTGIYYWKCDRAAAFHGTDAACSDTSLMASQLRHALQRRFPGMAFEIHPANGQGNHRTFRLTGDVTRCEERERLHVPGGSQPAADGPSASEAFIRTEDGPEADNYFDVETVVTEQLRALGLAVPQVWACDCAREATPFAWQMLAYIPHPDLNHHFKSGTLALAGIAEAIGEAIARWQEVKPTGFGPFSAKQAKAHQTLAGLHASYDAYYTLNLQRHLRFLVERTFLTSTQAQAIMAAIARHQALLDVRQGVLVHKDLALWNILGAPDRIAAFIDWDDAISGDPMDDLSLLACFHGEPVIARALAGYARVRPLPEHALPRFWLHLLRNMIVKAVIRVGAGYFTRDDGFYLINAGSNGGDLETLTRMRLDTALQGLNENCDLSILP